MCCVTLKALSLPWLWGGCHDTTGGVEDDLAPFTLSDPSGHLSHQGRGEFVFRTSD